MRLRALIPAAGTLLLLTSATGIVYALRPVAPTLSLGVVYTPAVLVAAALYGLRYGLGAAVVAMVAFNFLFLPRCTRSLSPTVATGPRLRSTP